MSKHHKHQPPPPEDDPPPVYEPPEAAQPEPDPDAALFDQLAEPVLFDDPPPEPAPAPADAIDTLTYTPPAITASGTTFVQLQAAGLSGHLERLIAAQAGLNTPTTELLRSAKNNNLQDAYKFFRSTVEQFIAGQPVATAAIKAQMLAAQTTFALYATLANEIGVLVDANPGSLHNSTNGIGNAIVKRTWP
jgi:hypothetical protein